MYEASSSTDNPLPSAPSVRGIAKRFFLTSPTTLQRRINGTQAARQAGAIGLQRLAPEEEEVIVYHIHLLARFNFPPRTSKIRFMAEAMIKIKGDPSPLGPNWPHRFVTRQPTIKSMFSQGQDKQRSEISYATITNWFDLWSKVVTDYDIALCDQYNMDEKGFAMGVQGKQKVILPKLENAIRTQCGNREWVSLIECVSVDGFLLPPWIIFKGKQQKVV